MNRAMAEVYDLVIVRMTAKWYKAVFERLRTGDRVLDIGIGTGTALARNYALVLQKKLAVVGIDYEEAYIVKARSVVKEVSLKDSVILYCKSVYDEQLSSLFSGDARFDAVYFSGSLTLMPDPPKALRIGASMLKDGGRVYITQTFQDRKSSWAEVVKPWLQTITTIDFGKVTYRTEMEAIISRAGLTILEDGPVAGSISTAWQTARMYVLEHRADHRRL